MAQPVEALETPETDKITCQHCHEPAHVMSVHLYKKHPELVEKAKLSLEEIEGESELDLRKRIMNQLECDYTEEFPHAPRFSEQARLEIQNRAEKAAQAAEKELETPAVEETALNDEIVSRPLYKVFNVTRSKATRNAAGEELMVDCLATHDYQYMVPKVDPDYIWDLRLLKTIIMGVENKIPAYLWGYAGVGKSTGFKQYCAATNRPIVRVQHTGDTESSHIIGQTLANEKGTYFNPGPLALAMKHGWFYLADEYDFAFPQVTSVYQPVLENESLYIKEADEEWRITEPHKNFYMAATGNTNGAGDESGLFQGTTMQNAANYERYGIVEKVEFLQPKQEKRLLSRKLNVAPEHIEKIVAYCGAIRQAYEESKITNTAGQRVALNMAKIYLLKGSYMTAANLSFINRLPEACRVVASEVAQRHFGE